MSVLDASYGLEPEGAAGCDLCDAWRAERAVAREDRTHRRVRQTNAEIICHPHHRTWPGGEAAR
ncbi:hypothetical protein A8W25_24810 [Streptomyces sp. ERV7]|uniref:hypothetical protein n=1 Tax=Streptomyces sp. ERV7 TaxID=1322334 RepID=UPI0007F55E04|nr:hypothetical protein [Streptomyces sp. ERV7]OAR22797.1 hypothetical protein A8W25_24810 [Streptomyces sp. ERV7]